MGVSDLRDIAVLESQPLSAYSGQTVAIDAYQYLYCYSTVIVRYREEEVYTADTGENLSNILSLLKGIPMLLQENIDPIFVFDGSADSLKQETIEARETKRKDAEAEMQRAADRGDVDAMRKYKARTQRITPTVIETSKRLLDLLGIPHTDAPKAGEAHAAALVEHGYADVVMSDDYDSLLFGAPVTVRQYSGSGDAERMPLEPTLVEHDITYQQLVDLALLLGTDYNPGVSGIGTKRGLKKIKKHGDIETVLDEYGASIENVDTLRSLFIESDSGEIPSEPELSQSIPDFEQAIAYAADWGLPEDELRKKISRFPRYYSG